MFGFGFGRKSGVGLGWEITNEEGGGMFCYGGGGECSADFMQKREGAIAIILNRGTCSNLCGMGSSKPPGAKDPVTPLRSLPCHKRYLHPRAIE
jgi:hypothetical protein